MDVVAGGGSLSSFTSIWDEEQGVLVSLGLGVSSGGEEEGEAFWM